MQFLHACWLGVQKRIKITHNLSGALFQNDLNTFI